MFTTTIYSGLLGGKEADVFLRFSEYPVGFLTGLVVWYGIKYVV